MTSDGQCAPTATLDQATVTVKSAIEISAEYLLPFSSAKKIKIKPQENAAKAWPDGMEPLANGGLSIRLKCAMSITNPGLGIGNRILTN